MDNNPLTRFSGRAQSYHRFRPGYPEEIITFLKRACKLSPGGPVADFGAGTGIFTRLLLDKGMRVFAVEPNEAMRKTLRREIKGAGVIIVDGKAEESNLPDQSICAVCAAQAFHWFEPEQTRREWLRILKPPGMVALIWNERDKHATPFLRGYEALLQKHCPEYAGRRCGYADDEAVRAFFAPQVFHKATFPNRMKLNKEGVFGLLHSSSYVPLPDSAAYIPLRAEAEALFEEHKDAAGEVEFLYRCSLYYGRLV